MTNMVPNPEDFDFSEMEEQLKEVNVTNVFPVSAIDDASLLKKYRELTAELMNRKEATNPKTPTGRDLHSERAACLLELRRRKIM